MNKEVLHHEHDHSEHDHSEHSHTPKKDGGSITIKLPKIKLFTAQSFVLLLLIGVGVLQSVQLFGLGQSVASANTKPAAPAVSSSSGTSSSGSGSSALPTMVGGC